MAEDQTGIEKARQERKRAERDLAEVIAQRPKVRNVEKASTRIRLDDQFAQLAILAMRGGRT